MGRIENVVKKFTVQKCVYWGNPVNDRKGGWTFDDPVELDCRWDEKQELKDGYDNNHYSSQASVLVNQDLSRRGYLWLGSLQDLYEQGNLETNPVDIIDAYIIIQFEKIPMVRKNDDFVRTAYLYDQG